MNPELDIWSLLRNSLRAGTPAALLYVLESRGSSPGRTGFCMAVTALGEMAGSIGGGVMEHKLVELARERLRTGAAPSQVKRQVHSKEAAKDRSGMICSGEQTVWLHPVDSEELPAIEAIVRCLEEDRPGTLELSPEGLRFVDSAPASRQREFLPGDAWRYRGPIGKRDTIHIIGGGHCSLALSRQMAVLGFRVEVYEDRAALHTLERNGYAHGRHLLPHYGALCDVPLGEGDVVVVMTVGYRTDAEALRALNGRQFGYLGVLGSRKKIEQLWAELRAEGVDENWIRSIYAPVGLDIKSETPEEIAVSIAAQIIAVRKKARVG